MIILTKEDFERFTLEQDCANCIFNKYCRDLKNKSICDIINVALDLDE